MASIIQGARLHHIAIQSIDWEKSRHFYEDLLGLSFVGEFEFDDERFAFFEIGDGTYIELYHPTGNNEEFSKQTLTHFAIQCENIVEIVEVIRKAGYKISLEITDVILGKWDARIAFVKGVNGESIELFELKI